MFLAFSVEHYRLDVACGGRTSCTPAFNRRQLQQFKNTKITIQNWSKKKWYQYTGSIPPPVWSATLTWWWGLELQGPKRFVIWRWGDNWEQTIR